MAHQTPHQIRQVVETCWLCQLLQELHNPLTRRTIVYCDNVSAVYLSNNPVLYYQTKHVKIDLHFVWEQVAIGDVCVLHIPTTLQFVNIFTKDCLRRCFRSFSRLNV